MKIKKYPAVSSTQETAKKMKEFEPWTVVLAEEQKAGYGREKRSWFSPRGGLYFSVILPKSRIDDLQTLTILAAFIVAKVVKENFKLEPFIKLPNDVYVGSKKICGILTENIIVGAQVRFSVMGIGLNTNIDKFPEELKNGSTSLKIEIGKKVDNKKILEKIIKELKTQFETISD